MLFLIFLFLYNNIQAAGENIKLKTPPIIVKFDFHDNPLYETTYEQVWQSKTINSMIQDLGSSGDGDPVPIAYYDGKTVSSLMQLLQSPGSEAIQKASDNPLLKKTPVELRNHFSNILYADREQYNSAYNFLMAAN